MSQPNLPSTSSGGEVQRAIHYWQQAGDNAVRRNAHSEAIAALRKGLALLSTLPDSPERTQRELALQLTLGELLTATQGMASPASGEAYSRAHALCQQVGKRHSSSERSTASSRFITPRRSCTPGEHSASSSSTWRNASAIRSWCAKAICCWEPPRSTMATLSRPVSTWSRAWISPLPSSPPPLSAAGLHPQIESLAKLMRVLWLLGYADQAQLRSQEALALARHVGHTPSGAYAAYFVTTLSQCRRDAVATHAQADALMALAQEQGLVSRLEQGRILRGWALAMQGAAAAGVAQIRQGLAAHERAGVPQLGRPAMLALLAEAYGQAGQPEVGLRVLAEALTLVATTEARWWEAELHRLQGPCGSNSRFQTSPRQRPASGRPSTWPTARRRRCGSCGRR